MTTWHPEMAAGRWQTFSLVEQLANVGSEIERALNWTARGNVEAGQRAFERGLELLGLTIADPKHRGRLRELTRLREVLLDYFFGENEHGSSAQSWHRYFHSYGVAVAIRKHGACPDGDPATRLPADGPGGAAGRSPC